jgi:predicted branched-subunit amino acid permease
MTMTTTLRAHEQAHDGPRSEVRAEERAEVRAEVRAGAMAIAPLFLGYAPYALVIGSAVAAHGDPLAGWSGSWLIYGGSAHLSALRTLEQSGVVLAIVTSLLVNARLLVYSASMAAHWRHQPRWFRIVGGALLIDPTWALAEQRATQPGSDRARRAHHLGAAITLGIGWSGLIALGAVAGNLLGGAGLEVTVPLCLVTMIAPKLRQADSLAVVVVAIAVAFAARGFPPGTGTLAAIAAGCLAGRPWRET